MRFTQKRNIAGLAVLMIGMLGIAFWTAAASGVRYGANKRLMPGGSPISKPVPADEPTRLSASEMYGKLPLSFEINKGQTDGQVKFLSRGAGYTLFLTSNEAVLSLKQPKGEAGTPRVGKSSVLRMKLVAANAHAKTEGLDQLPGKSNYLIGKNPRNWRTNVSLFERVYYHEIYKGVDLVYYGNQRQLENDFVVAAGADPNVITLAFNGAKKIDTDNEGNLLLETDGGEVQVRKPVIYQVSEGGRQEIAGKYVLKSSGEVGFEVGTYDHARQLVIDPVLIYSSYLGGNGTEAGNAIVVDDAGNAYITGGTSSTTFPLASPIDATLGGTEDAFVVKINPTGTALVYSTYLGGSSTDKGIDISVDGGQDAYVTGRTASSDFPVMNALDSTYSGGTVEDAFVVRINAAGSALVYSTYLSGNFGARGCGIWANNSQGFAYVTGTTSVNFPVTSSAFEATNFNSGFLTKLCTNCSGASSLVYSTFLAHTGTASGQAIAADVAGNAYITGNVSSNATSFATTGALQTTFGGGSADAFVEKFNTNLSGAASRIYATYLGGSGKDIGGADGSLNPGKAIAIDELGNAYITGATNSTNFPVANASQLLNGGQNDAFLAKLNATGTSLSYSTYLGGTGDDFGKSVAVNIGGGAYVTGVAGPNFPTVNSLVTPNPGIGFVTKFNPSGAGVAVIYSTILSGVTGGSNGIALDGAGDAFVTGSTNASIVTVNPFQPINGGGGTDAWVSTIADPTIVGRVFDVYGRPLRGATVYLGGVPSATTTTDENGGYTFGLLSVGNNYTVSVGYFYYLYPFASVSNLQKNVRQDFSPLVVSISGQVTLNGSGMSGVLVFVSGSVYLSARTDAQGNYIFTNVPLGRTCSVEPYQPGFGFTPRTSPFFNIASDQTANFTAYSLPSIQFSSASYSINEGDPSGRVNITLTRTGNTTISSSISYRTIDAAGLTNCNVINGTASPRCDYINTLGSVTFAPGETSKSFSIGIIEDSYAEGNESFSLSLYYADNTTIGSPASATVTITDDDGTNGPNPIDSTNFFVRQQYSDFLNREPDPPGLAGWTSIINNCSGDTTQCDRVHVSQLFFQSEEFQSRGYFVYRFYPVAFGRKPDYEEFLPDLARVGGFLDNNQLEEAKAQFIADFMTRTAFSNTYDGLTNQQYVDALLNTAGVTLASRQAMIDGLNSLSLTRAQVLRQIVESSEVAAKYNHQAYAVMEYFGYLRRQPDALYLDWIQQLDQNNNPRVMVNGFVNSAEYRQRFGP
ncbi:MAG: SBBP repeat-containing protein [bacterium]